MLFLGVRGFSDYAGPTVHSRLARLPCCLPPTRNEVGILIYGLFAAQSPRPPIPLSTLQAASRDVACKTQGQDGFATLLSRRALSSPTTCRFIPALSGLPTSTRNCVTETIEKPEPIHDHLAYSLSIGCCLFSSPTLARAERPIVGSCPLSGFIDSYRGK